MWYIRLEFYENSYILIKGLHLPEVHHPHHGAAFGHPRPASAPRRAPVSRQNGVLVLWCMGQCGIRGWGILLTGGVNSEPQIPEASIL